MKIVDLDLNKPYSSNRIEGLENSLPFCRSLIIPFCNHIRKAEKMAGGNGYVTIEYLKEEFASPAWEGLNNKNSVLVKILLSSAFKNKKREFIKKITFVLTHSNYLAFCTAKETQKTKLRHGTIFCKKAAKKDTQRLQQTTRT
jgi:hypothetical protein